MGALFNNAKVIGSYKKRDICRFCGESNLLEVLNLGNVPLAGGFLKENDFKNEKYYPLTLSFCKDCCLLQSTNVIPADTLFRNNYFFFSSSIRTLVDHFKEYAKDIYERYLQDLDNPLILEIGCNDGVLLKPFSDLGVQTLGVDPATNVVKSIDIKNCTVFNDYFTERLAVYIKKQFGSVDVIVANFSFAHIDDMDNVIKGIKCLLKDDGVFVFEIYYLGTLIDEMNYDMIYHEHMSYYSIITLIKFFRRFEMEIFDLKYIPSVRTGSVRFFARNLGYRPEEISSAVDDMVKYEYTRGFNKPDIYKEYCEKINYTKKMIIYLLSSLKRKGKTIIGYGASGRGTIIMNYCGIDGRYLDYVVDDAKSKQGFFTPGTHLPIRSWDFVEKSKFPDYIVLFAWAFADEVINKRQDYIMNGGKFIIPLPQVRIYPE